MVFGGAGVGAGGTLELSSLTGSNGFKLNGIAAGDYSGYSVASAGDLNGDGVADLVIGAYGADPHGSQSGQSYVVFGGAGVGAGGTLELSSLTGSNGFKLSGIAGGDYSGFSVASAGDLNGDEVDDLVIGAYLADPNGLSSGQSYVVFGGASVGAGGTLELSSLNGSNGFKLNGIAAGDWSGRSVASAGDLNGDGVADLVIGAYYADPNGSKSGQSYVVFGDQIALSNNQLTINQGETLILTSSNLNATSINHDDALLQFQISDCQQGQFEWVSNPTVPITLFYQQNITDAKVQFVHNGSVNPPAYDVSSLTEMWASTVFQAATIDFNLSPVLVNNVLTIYQSETVILSGSDLSATDPDNNDTELTFVINALEHGQFEIVTSPGNSVSNFFQQNITDNRIQFVQDGSINSPAYNVSVSDGFINTPSQAATINFGIPILVNNAMNVNQGETLIITSSNLSATDSNDPDSTLQFTISNLQNGNFEFVSNPSNSILNFMQQNITDANVQFVQNGTPNAPSYSVTVSDGTSSTEPSAAVITFNAAPVLGNHKVKVNQGETVLLTSSDFSATDVDNSASEITFLVNAVQHGQFEAVSNQGVAITSFTQAQVNASAIQFVQDGSATAPAFTVAVTDGTITTTPVAGVIDFNAAPILITNQLSISQGESEVLSSSNLNATDVDNINADLQFSVTGVMHGQFGFVSNPGVTITTFYQQNITESQVQFIQNDTPSAPAYDVAVSDGVVSTLPAPSTITFNYKPVLTSNTLTLNQGETKVLTSADLDSTDVDNTPSELTLVISNLYHGQFELSVNPGVGILSFTQTQVNSNSIQFVPDGSANAPSYNVSVNDGQVGTAPEAATVTFNLAPVFINNELTINQDQTIILSPNDISATDPDSADGELLFTVSNLQHGQFERVANPSVVNTNFTQQQINDNAIQFAHDGSNFAPTYSLSINDGIFTTLPQAANITYSNVNYPPVIVNNQMTINQGETLLFTSAQLSATDADNSDAGLQFILSNVQHGRFDLVDAPGVTITQLTQQKIYSGSLRFTHDDSVNAPSYQVTVSDSSKTDGPEAATIHFNAKPIIETNNLSLDRGKTVLLYPFNLRATDVDTDDRTLLFQVSDLSNGQFEWVDNPGTIINNFQQHDIDSINVQFVHDGSKNKPSYNITVSDGKVDSLPSQAAIKWGPDFQNGVTPRGTDNTARNTLIGTFLSVGLVGTLLLCYISMGFLKNRRLKAVGQRGNEEQARFYKTVIIPIAQAVFKQIKVTGFMNYISTNQMEVYVAEIAVIVNEINQLGIHVELQEMKPDHQTQLLNQIVKQMKRHLGIQTGVCNRAWFASFFKAQVRPEMIGAKAKLIASSVHAALMGNPDEDFDEVEMSNMRLLAGDERRDSVNSQDILHNKDIEIARLQNLLEEREQQHRAENEKLRELLKQQGTDGSFNSTTSYMRL